MYICTHTNNTCTHVIMYVEIIFQEVDYSQNEVEEIPQDLSQYTSITKLILDGMYIT